MKNDGSSLYGEKDTHLRSCEEYSRNKEISPFREQKYVC